MRQSALDGKWCPLTRVTDVLAAITGGATADSLESQQLEFKSGLGDTRDLYASLAEAAVCFANASGGLLLVGVRDRPGGTDALVGTELDIDVLRRRIHALTSPPLLVTAEEVVHEGVRLVALAVPESVEVHSTSRGMATRRLATDCIPMTPAEIVRLSNDRQGRDWSAEPSGRSLEAVDPAAVRRVRELLRTSGQRSLADATDLDLLRAMRLVLDDLTLTRAADLLLCQPAEHAPELFVYQHRTTAGGETDAVIRGAGPALLAFDTLMTAVAVRQGMTPVTLRSGMQLKIEDYPLAAVREAVVNALAHADHRERRPIQVEHSPDALVITSPGPFVSGVTSSNVLTHISKPRSKLLLDAFRRLDLAEENGQGIDRMFREMAGSGRDLPIIAEASGDVRVTFLGKAPDTRVTTFIAELPDAERDSTAVLLTLHTLCRRPSLNANDLAPVLQRSIEETQNALSNLALGEAQLIEVTKGTASRRFPNYRLRHSAVAALGPALSYRRRDTRELDKKVTDHLREYGWINNATLQRLFDVDVYRARDLLRDLVGRELLVRTSTQTRGSAVRYGPGPKFPKARGRRR